MIQDPRVILFFLGPQGYLVFLKINKAVAKFALYCICKTTGGMISIICINFLDTVTQLNFVRKTTSFLTYMLSLARDRFILRTEDMLLNLPCIVYVKLPEE